MILILPENSRNRRPRPPAQINPARRRAVAVRRPRAGQDGCIRIRSRSMTPTQWALRLEAGAGIVDANTDHRRGPSARTVSTDARRSFPGGFTQSLTRWPLLRDQPRRKEPGLPPPAETRPPLRAGACSSWLPGVARTCRRGGSTAGPATCGAETAQPGAAGRRSADLVEQGERDKDHGSDLAEQLVGSDSSMAGRCTSSLRLF